MPFVARTHSRSAKQVLLSLLSLTRGFVACFSLFRSYIARYAPLKNKKNTLKKFYKNFKDINLNNFLLIYKDHTYNLAQSIHKKNRCEDNN